MLVNNRTIYLVQINCSKFEKFALCKQALKSVGLSSSQPGQQTLPTGPSIQQHLAMHPYSQHSLPLNPYANMMSYPFLPQSYTYMPSGFQPGFAGNSTYHQQLAAMLPQYKNSVSMSSLTQSPAAASGYGSYGGSTAVPGSYQVSQPAGPAGSYDDVLNAHFKDTSHLLSLQQQQQQVFFFDFVNYLCKYIKHQG